MFNSDYQLVQIKGVVCGDLSYKTSTFPGGEEYVILSEDSVQSIRSEDVIEFYLNSASSEAIMKLFALADAVKRVNEFAILHLRASYLPHGRQDRVCKPGEAYSLDMFIRLVSTMFKKLITFDAHNEYVTANLCEKYKLGYHGIAVNNSTSYPHKLFLDDKGKVQYTCEKYSLVRESTGPYDELDTLYVFPDYGAKQKYLKNAGVLKVFATKKRNYDDSGKMVSLTHYFEEGINREILSRNTNIGKAVVLDDICDGGATFSSLAKSLRDVGICKPTLCISHGIFSKGAEGIKQLLDDYVCIRLVHTPFNLLKLRELGLIKPES